jgi:hypothetical protein
MAMTLLPPKVVVASLIPTIALTEKRRQSVRMRIIRMFIMHLLSQKMWVQPCRVMQIDGHLIFDRGVAFPTAHAERI